MKSSARRQRIYVAFIMLQALLFPSIRMQMYGQQKKKGIKLFAFGFVSQFVCELVFVCAAAAPAPTTQRGSEFMYKI